MSQPNLKRRIDLAFDALAAQDWAASESYARSALNEADDPADDGETAMARFLLGTALAGPDATTPASRAEARTHLAAALPVLEQQDELELAGGALLLLGGLALEEACATGDGGLEPLSRCERHYRRAAELFSGLDAPESEASALHNLGLCLTALAELESASPDRRRERLDEALQCFHDALEVEIQDALPQLAEASEQERQLVQALRDYA